MGVNTLSIDLDGVVKAPDVVDLAHLLVANECVEHLEETRDNNRCVMTSRLRYFKILDQRSLDALTDTSLDVKDREENALGRHRGDVDPMRGDNVEALCVAVRTTIQRQGDGNIQVIHKCHQQWFQDAIHLGHLPQDRLGGHT